MICRQCGEEKEFESFVKSKSKPNGILNLCKHCNNQNTKKYRKTSDRSKEREPDRKRKQAYRFQDKEKYNAYMRDYMKEYRPKLYGITVEKHSELLLAQNNACAICKEVPKTTLCIDHNHATGEVRGLLCNQCNKALGGFADSTERLSNAIEYLSSSYTKH